MANIAKFDLDFNCIVYEEFSNDTRIRTWEVFH